MTRFIRATLGASVLILVTTAALTAGQDAQASRQPAGDGLPDGPGKDVTLRVCGACHEARQAASVRLTRDGWAGVIDGMTKLGAKGTEQDFAVVLEYLATNFPGEAAQPLNVNKAPQIDLEAVAGLLRREAAAVIAYREKNGPFKTLDDLKKVPGLDFKKIDSRRDFIVAQ